jgi:hypothetical protein
MMKSAMSSIQAAKPTAVREESIYTTTDVILKVLVTFATMDT